MIDTAMTKAIVTLCDHNYFGKAIQTIRDVRSIGQWSGDLVLISVGFTPPQDLCEKYGIQTVTFPNIPIQSLIDYYKANPLSIATLDARETNKGVQWEKLHVFDVYFRKWECVLFMDAGLRVLDSVDAFFSLNWKGRIMALDDTWNDPNKKFRCQIEMANNPSAVEALTRKYGSGILDESYFLNCIWIFDTSLITESTKQEMIDIMNKYPIWRTNEMCVMNLFFHFHLRRWTPFPAMAKNGKYLFDWCEYNRPSTKWYQYCALKYPVTLPRGKTIGVAIPCYNKHIPKLIELLDSIESQTRKPDIVSISCSSTKDDEFPKLRDYGFGIIVSTTPERKNTGQNRNIAARRLDTDIISFFDADDNMHPQRIEGLIAAFNEPCDIALHGYLTDNEVNEEYDYINNFKILRNKLSQCYSGCIKLDSNSRIHHAQVTVRKEIFQESPFTGEDENVLKDDCIFCYRIFNLPGIQTAYLDHSLSKYIPAFTCIAYADGKE